MNLRFDECYDLLVDETENKLTLHDKVKNQRLSDLLNLFEYIMGEYDENPLYDWFDIQD